MRESGVKEEERALSRISKASSERVDTARRAKALLAVKAGVPFTQAARRSGFKSADSVSQLVQRFNQQGLAALFIAAGRGRQATGCVAKLMPIVYTWVYSTD